MVLSFKSPLISERISMAKCTVTFVFSHLCVSKKSATSCVRTGIWFLLCVGTAVPSTVVLKILLMNECIGYNCDQFPKINQEHLVGLFIVAMLIF